MKQTSQSFRYIASLLALGLGISAASAAHAADKEKPPYDVGELPKGFEVEWPASPDIEQDASVSTVEEFNKAAATAGTRITVEGKIDRAGTITANDVEVQMNDGASLGGLRVERGVKRVFLNGGTYTNTVEIAYPTQFYPSRVSKPEWQAEDILIDGVDVTSPTTAFFLRGNRVALLHSTTHSEDYAVFSDTGEGMQNHDVILADNDLTSNGHQATVRLISARESVTVDNRITSLMSFNGLKHNYRVHGQTDKAFAARNELVNAGVMLSTIPGDHTKQIWFEDNTFHHQTPDLFNPSRTTIDELYVHDNTAYTNVWKCLYCLSPVDGWDFGDNVVKPYEPPPAL
jgi:hypothetical protein